jgi:methyl-accepting chemotaxis protein
MTELVETSLTVAEDAGTMLTQLVPNIQQTAYLVQEISAASQEQTAGVQQIDTAVQQLDQVTQQNSAMAEELASAAEALSTQAASMQETLTTTGLGVHQSQAPQKSPSTSKPTETTFQPPDSPIQVTPQQDEHDKDFERY